MRWWAATFPGLQGRGGCVGCVAGGVATYPPTPWGRVHQTPHFFKNVVPCSCHQNLFVTYPKTIHHANFEEYLSSSRGSASPLKFTKFRVFGQNRHIIAYCSHNIDEIEINTCLTYRGYHKPSFDASILLKYFFVEFVFELKDIAMTSL